MTYHLVYKLTNLVNGKIYIGCHMTKNLEDSYMGSGRRLHYAKKKYGVENFKKEILSSHETPEEMLAEEAQLVNEEFLGRDDVYNLQCGGKGSWFWVNQTGRDLIGRQAAWKKCKELYREKDSKFYFTMKNNLLRGNKSRSQDPQQLAKMQLRAEIARSKIPQESRDRVGKINSIKQTGSRNSQHGTCWIYSEIEKRSLKIKIDEVEKYLSLDWNKGRKLKF